MRINEIKIGKEVNFPIEIAEDGAVSFKEILFHCIIISLSFRDSYNLNVIKQPGGMVHGKETCIHR